MISASDREMAVQLIEEAMSSGAACAKACDCLGIAESLFKTLKYRPNFQPKGFATLEEARAWVQLFVHWYNYEHRHSGLKFLTPEVHRLTKAGRRKVSVGL